MDKERIKNYNCPVDAAMDILGGKYKAIIVYKLINKTLRYNEIQKLIPKATPRMLSKQLRELEQDNIINRIFLNRMGKNADSCCDCTCRLGKITVPPGGC